MEIIVLAITLVMVLVVGRFCQCRSERNRLASRSSPMETSLSDRWFFLFAVSRYTKQFQWREEQWTLQQGDGTPASIYIAISENGSREEFHPHTFVKPIGVIMLPHSIWQAQTKEQVGYQRSN